MEDAQLLAAQPSFRADFLRVIPGANGVGEFFYSFGFRTCSLAVCATCMQAVHLNGRSAREIAGYMYSHAENHSATHPPSRRPSRSELVDEIKKQLSDDGELSCVKRCSVILRDDWVMGSIQANQHASGFKPKWISICNACFCVRRAKIPCCSPSKAIRACALWRYKSEPIVALSPALYTQLIRDRARMLAPNGQGDMSASSTSIPASGPLSTPPSYTPPPLTFGYVQGPPLPLHFLSSSSSNQANQAPALESNTSASSGAIPSHPASTAPAAPASGGTPPPPPGHGSGALFSSPSSSSGSSHQRNATPTSETAAIMREFAAKQESDRKLIEGLRLAVEEARGFPPVQDDLSDLRNLASIAGAALSIVQGLKRIPEDEQRRMAKASGPLDPGDSRSILIKRAAEEVIFLSSNVQLPKLTQLLRTLVAKGPQIATAHVLPVSTEAHGQEPNVQMLKGLGAASRRTDQARAQVLCRFLKAIMVLGADEEETTFLGDLRARLMKSIESCEQHHEHDPDPPTKWDIGNLAVDIIMILYDVATDKARSIDAILVAFSYTLSRPPGSGSGNQTTPDDGGDSDDDDELEFADEDDSTATENAPLLVRATSPAMMKHVCSSILALLKLAVASVVAVKVEHSQRVTEKEFLLRKSQMCDLETYPLAEREVICKAYQTAENALVEPIKLIAEMHAGALNQALLAQYIHHLGTLLRSSSGPENTVTKVQDENGDIAMVIGNGGRISRANVREMGEHLIRKLEGSLVDCFLDAHRSDVHRFFRLVFREPKMDALRIVLLAPRANGGPRDVGLAGGADDGLLERLLHHAAQSASHNGKEYVANVERFRDVLFAAIFAFSGAVLRPADLCHLELFARGGGRGNLTPVTTYSGETTLAFNGPAVKTGKCSVVFLPPFLAKLVLFCLKCLALRAVPVVVAEFSQATQGRADQNEWTLAFEGKVEHLLTSSLYARCRLGAAFKKTLRGLAASATVYIPSKCLHWMSDAEVRAALRQEVSNGGLHNNSLDARQLRKVMVVFKTNLVEMCRPDALTADEAFRARFERFRKALDENGQNLMRHPGMAYLGMHSAETDLAVYQFQKVLGNGGESVPAVLYEVALQAQALIALFFDFPQIDGVALESNRYRPYATSRMPSIYEGWLESCRSTHPPSALSVLEQALRKFGGQRFASFISDKQKQACVAVFTSTHDVCLFLPCGSGKTLSYALPLVLAARGFSVIFVPFKVLVTSTVEALNRMFGQGSAVVFDPRNPEFAVSSFAAEPSHWKTGSTRFVVAIIDSIVLPKMTSFLAVAARRSLLWSIVIDEAHQVLTSRTYRDVQYRASALAGFGTRLILASGTVPATMEPSLVRELGLVQSATHVFRAPDVYVGRITIHLEEVASNYATHVQNALGRFLAAQQQRGALRRALVFAPTVVINGNLFEAFGKGLATDSAIDAVKLDSGTDDDGRERFLDAFRNRSAHVVGFCTTAGAEGIDLPDIEMVIVAGAVMGGILTLHQMFNRAARGGGRSRCAQAVFIYEPKLAQTLTSSSDENLVRVFDTSARVAMRKLVTNKGMADALFGAGARDQCAAIAMTKALGNDVSADAEGCGECSRCRQTGAQTDDPGEQATRPIAAAAHSSHARDPLHSSGGRARERLIGRSAAEPGPLSLVLQDADHGGGSETGQTQGLASLGAQARRPGVWVPNSGGGSSRTSNYIATTQSPETSAGSTELEPTARSDGRYGRGCAEPGPLSVFAHASADTVDATPQATRPLLRRGDEVAAAGSIISRPQATLWVPDSAEGAAAGARNQMPTHSAAIATRPRDPNGDASEAGRLTTGAHGSRGVATTSAGHSGGLGARDSVGSRQTRAEDLLRPEADASRTRSRVEEAPAVERPQSTVLLGAAQGASAGITGRIATTAATRSWEVSAQPSTGTRHPQRATPGVGEAAIAGRVENVSYRAAQTGRVQTLDEFVLSRPSIDVQQSVERKEMHTALGFLNANCGMCVICSGEAHYPNNCEVLKRLCRFGQDACLHCFNRGHRLQDREAALKSSASQEEKYENATVRGCAVVVKNCSAWQSLRPCDACLLSHAGDGCPFKGKPEKQTAARAILIFSWSNPKAKEEMIREFEGVAQWDTWWDFFRWAVYGGSPTVQNLYRVVNWFSASRSRQEALESRGQGRGAKRMKTM